MVRTPEIKEQARLLVQLLKQQGIELGHQVSLNIAAQLGGHRNWNTAQAAPGSRRAKSVAPAPRLEDLVAGITPENRHAEVASTPPGFDLLLQAADDVVSNADSAGCGGDLTVTSASAVQRLDELLTSWRRDHRFVAPHPTYDFDAEDILVLRPDLTEAQCREVLQSAARNFDANVGVNWDVLRATAHRLFPFRVAVQVQLADQQGKDDGRALTLDYSTGMLYDGELPAIAKLPHAHRDAKMVSPAVLKGMGTPVVYLPDGTFIDLEPHEGCLLFGGDAAALRTSLQELRDWEARAGKCSLIGELPR